ncbi:hypothetical protein HMPREF0860_1186 [Treponema socranskii subsp. socranskii VPI DR56BR1116 = ATCC 35536]|uniref:Uncharacterized protein n=1 Tax=Treponema socranskii subsp. socranskii VPI DR56BR1116 = ATCC 35536 TaxID=1125725 RepID=U1GS60_TRESO|nr:hypothetical protein HMPREF1325_0453 [Treponema socranskii subsp. socranskii VPI DR56BR1116 = ATCC 35536]ERK01604.1 hypothetical protein HMPREF0860_1186 [Treponema socranskii subsp. socranskii VPI DR56BR1116 = ATCC 35536]
MIFYSYGGLMPLHFASGMLIFTMRKPHSRVRFFYLTD